VAVSNLATALNWLAEFDPTIYPCSDIASITPPFSSTVQFPSYGRLGGPEMCSRARATRFEPDCLC